METNSNQKLISGVKWAQLIRNEIKSEVSLLQFKPKLVGILVGNREDSKIYIRNKERALLEVGMDYALNHFPEDVEEMVVIELVRSLNEDPTVHGILIQLPLPSHLDEKKVLGMMDPKKDVDGIASPMQLGKLAYRGYTADFIPCTARACLELLKRENVKISGMNAIVLGRSNIVGMPVALLLLREGATVTICHSKTQNINKIIENADIVIAAIGSPLFVKGEWIKPGAIVIDVGINRIEDMTKKTGFKLVGDVDFEKAVDVCSKITPVPGGVGPMTIAMLLLNTLESAKRTI